MPAAGVATPRGRLCPGQPSAAEVPLVRIAVERGAADFEAFLEAQVSFHDPMLCVFVFGLCYRVN